MWPTRRGPPAPDHLSLAAEDHGRIVGHILFTPVVGEIEGVGLTPMTVPPERQRRGIGSALVRHGLELVRERSIPLLGVVGGSEDSSRFGFEFASRCGLWSQWKMVPSWPSIPWTSPLRCSPSSARASRSPLVTTRQSELFQQSEVSRI